MLTICYFSFFVLATQYAFCVSPFNDVTILTSVEYLQLNSSQNNPIKETLTYNVTQCNLGDVKKQIYFPIPFYIGGSQCWNVTSGAGLDLSKRKSDSLVVSAKYPKIAFDSSSLTFYWQPEQFGERATCEEFQARFS